MRTTAIGECSCSGATVHSHYSRKRHDQRGMKNMNTKKYQRTLTNATVKRLRMAPLAIFLYVVPALSFQMDLEFHSGDMNIKQSIILKTN